MASLPHPAAGENPTLAPDDADDTADLVDAEALPTGVCPFCGVPLACLFCFPDDEGVVLDLDAFRAAVLELVDAGVVNTVGEA
jgi:hypothetical protein